MTASACGGCGAEPQHPGSVIRITGKDAAGNTVTLCSRCFIQRDRDARPLPPQLAKGAKGRKR